MQIPILNGIYTDEASDFRTSYPRNLIPVPKSQGISQGYLRPADGIVEFGDGPGLDRGGINWDNVCYRVMGTKLVSIDLDGNATLIQNLIMWAEGNSTLLESVIQQMESNSTLLQQVIGWLDGNHSAIETLFTQLEGNATLLMKTVNALNGNSSLIENLLEPLVIAPG